MAETRYYRAPGGQLLALDWPPHEAVLAQITRGEMRRCDENGDPYVEPVEDGGPQELTPPAANARKDEWVGYVVRVTADTEHPVTVDEAQAMTVQDMRERYGQQ
ncbi:hypothetical protein GCM10010174_70080 [Kutzneria viridogrisea]|uniref:Uncharacterized protein n=1 Tax=Kutzneria viridogrisea TaxID=47990 RepID=A0ABR6BAX8_9PSEU|nr:hypothetical protein [Kutzneria viridogrisea]